MMLYLGCCFGLCHLHRNCTAQFLDKTRYSFIHVKDLKAVLIKLLLTRKLGVGGRKKSFELLAKFLGFNYLPVFFSEWFLQIVLLEIKVGISGF